jgi:hypothetical protein
MTTTTATKPRKPRTSGVRMSFSAFCEGCGWQGAHWFGEGSRSNAYAELRWHKQHADETGLKCSKKSTEVR